MARIFSIILGVSIVLASFYFGLTWKVEKKITIPKIFKEVRVTNHLAQEKSPYLLQHKDNPVNWYSWGEKAFEAARTQKKPIFLSIGYATCHWCHVMEKDSFETQEVADVLNAHFISIKLDREERPDLDQIYMDAVVSLNGQGGWPLSVFLTPDLKPFFGGTFFWKDQFIGLLKQINSVWVGEPGKLVEAAKELTEHVSQEGGGEAALAINEEFLRKAFRGFLQTFDAVHGGFGRAPKFPRSTDLSLLLRIHRRTGNKEALSMVTKTLDSMARGGIYDHLGGGFARYATDAKWMVPHFEKMLYDNALLAVTYLEAYQVTQNPMYADVAREVLDYVLREMTSPEGGFYSAQDADSEGVEGKYYVWTYEELNRVLSPEQLKLAQDALGVTVQGNFEHANILHVADKKTWEERQSAVNAVRGTLFPLRDKRIKPLLDDKVLVDWNGLMISAMAKGYQVLGDDKYLSAAQKAASFIKKKLYADDRLKRRYRDGESKIEGVLSDYAYLISGLLKLYESDGNDAWFTWALALQEKQDSLFWDDQKKGYFFASQGVEDLFARKKEFNDGAVPAASGVAAENLMRLFSYTGEKKLLDRAQETLTAMSRFFNRYPPGYASSLIAVDFLTDAHKEVVLAGNSADLKEFRQKIYEAFLPNQVIGWGESLGPPMTQGKIAQDGAPTIYVCENQVCKKPETNLDAAFQEMQHFKPYNL